VEKLENGGRGLNLTHEVRDGILNHKKDGNAATLEGKIVSFADRIAYINHDIDDAMRAGVLHPDDLPKDCLAVLGTTHSGRINNMILDLICENEGKNQIRQSEAFSQAMGALRDFMFKRVYTDPTAKAEEGKAKGIIEALYEYYYDHIDEIPPEFLLHMEQDGKTRVTADYIACMTDRFAVRTYQALFVPKSWGL